ncbi:hypothetical protein [Hymenobacter negativus]|uniref:Uncharacterized protein n=1 Tax=Hymenobacter negativus TaxID=2795026 RepID=A0ABS0QBK7_9BACT|nr:hypothetical protein [Hymenobacter negativus]MBH8560061.1 hypothetical protein [Hymenobacter negativus]
MPDSVIFSQPYGRVLVDAAVPCVITQWLTFANRADFIALQEAALVYFEAHSTPAAPWGWVGDIRRMGAIPAEVQEWLSTEFNARAVAAGLREVSIVEAENVFGQLAAQRYAHNTAHATPVTGLATALYPTLARAKNGARRALAAR